MYLTKLARFITNLLKHFKKDYVEKSNFIRSIIDTVEAKPENYMKIFRNKDFVRLKTISYNKTFYLYHGFPGDNSIGVIIQDGNFLGEIEELANGDLLPEKIANDVIRWYNLKTHNTTDFNCDIWHLKTVYSECYDSSI